MDDKPKIVSKIKIVVCTKCKTVQAWVDVERIGRCAGKEYTKGWNRCENMNFWEIE